jgi:hypothetical protein
MQSAEKLAKALRGRRIEPNWLAKCPAHHPSTARGRSLVIRHGENSDVLVSCWGVCNRLEVLTERLVIRSFLTNALKTNRRQVPANCAFLMGIAAQKPGCSLERA